MATRTITETDCDMCLKKNVPVKELRLVTHWEPDPAGGRSEEAGVMFDLCSSCMCYLCTKFMSQIPKERKAVKAFLDEHKISKTRTW